MHLFLILPSRVSSSTIWFFLSIRSYTLATMSTHSLALKFLVESVLLTDFKIELLSKRKHLNSKDTMLEHMKYYVMVIFYTKIKNLIRSPHTR